MQTRNLILLFIGMFHVCMIMENKAADVIEDLSAFKKLSAEVICLFFPRLSDADLCHVRLVSRKLCVLSLDEYNLRRNRRLSGDPTEFDRYAAFDRSILTWSLEDIRGIFGIDYRSYKAIEEDQLPSRSLRSLLLRLLPPEFYQFRSMTHLEINGTHIQHLPESFGKVTWLTSLKIKNNQRLVSLPKSLKALTNLTSLTISLNLALPQLPDLQRLTKITELDVSQNPLEDLPPLPPGLTKLHAHTTRLQNWPMSVNPLTRLVELNLSGNLIKSIQTWAPLLKLERLYLSKGLLSDLPDNASTALPLLVSIDLSDQYFLKHQESKTKQKFVPQVTVVMN